MSDVLAEFFAQFSPEEQAIVRSKEAEAKIILIQGQRTVADRSRFGDDREWILQPRDESRGCAAATELVAYQRVLIRKIDPVCTENLERYLHQLDRVCEALAGKYGRWECADALAQMREEAERLAWISLGKQLGSLKIGTTRVVAEPKQTQVEVANRILQVTATPEICEGAMEFNETKASAETELREAVLAEFLKPELPAPVTLLRHAERYLVRLFDAHAQLRLSDSPDPDEFSEYLRNMTTGLPRMFFGGLGFPWNTCIEYAMIGVVDHGPEPRPSAKEIMARYIDTQGQLFLTYALVARADYWRSKVARAERPMDEREDAPGPAKPTESARVEIMGENHILSSPSASASPPPDSPLASPDTQQQAHHVERAKRWAKNLRAARQKSKLSRPLVAKALCQKGVQITEHSIKKHEEGKSVPKQKIRGGYANLYKVTEEALFPPTGE